MTSATTAIVTRWSQECAPQLHFSNFTPTNFPAAVEEYVYQIANFFVVDPVSFREHGKVKRLS